MDRAAVTCLLLLVAMTTVVAPVTACMCGIEHPQTNFCQEDFALKVEVLSAGLVYPESADPVTNDTAPTARVYSAYVQRTFKGEASLNLTAEPGVVRLHTALSQAACGVDLDIGSRYVVTGMMTGLGATVNICGGVTLWESLTTQQRRGYGSKYGAACDCQPLPCYQPKCHQSADVDTCFWSWRHDVGMCHVRHAFCRRDAETGLCGWRRPDEFRMCEELFSM